MIRVKYDFYDAPKSQHMNRIPKGRTPKTSRSSPFKLLIFSKKKVHIFVLASRLFMYINSSIGIAL